jgi:hypothetical protein
MKRIILLTLCFVSIVTFAQRPGGGGSTGGGATAVTKHLNWAATTSYSAREVAVNPFGVTMFKNALGASGAVFNITEAGLWTYQGQSTITGFVGNQVYMAGQRIREGNNEWVSGSTRVSGATFDNAEMLQWQMVSQKLANNGYLANTEVFAPQRMVVDGQLYEANTAHLTAATFTTLEQTKWNKIASNAPDVVFPGFGISNASVHNIYGIDLSGGGGAGINLPTAVGNKGKKVQAYKTDATTSTGVVDCSVATETINGSLSAYTLSEQHKIVTFVSDGSNWLVENSLVNGMVEYGENNGITNNQTVTALADVVGSSFTLPSAGIWEVNVILNGQSNAGAGDGLVQVYTSGNVLVNANSQIRLLSVTANFAVNGSMVLYISTSGSETFKLRASAGSGTFLFKNQNGSSSANSKITWRKISGFVPIPGNVARESGAILLDNQIFSTNSYVASTNGVFTIPSAGKWRLRYTLSTDGTGANTTNQFRIVDGIGTLVSGSEKSRGGGSTISENIVGEPLEVTTTGATTFTLQARNGGSGSVTILNTALQASTISWEKVEGFLPVSFNDQALSGYFDVGNMRMQWGTATTNGSGVATVTFPVSFTTINSVTLGIQSGSNAAARLSSAATTTGFSLAAWITSTNATSNTTPVNWIAIGTK